MLSKAGVEVIWQAKGLCEKFIGKVETGRAGRKEIYEDCKNLLAQIIRWEAENADKSGG